MLSQPAARAAVRRAPASRPRLGFAGVGWIGRNRLEAIAQEVDVEIAAFADPSAESRAGVAERFADAHVAGSFDELLDLGLDGVVIATPSALHADQTIAALRRGCAVFCQKPLARDAAETRAVVAAARAADRLLGVDLSYRFTSGMQQIRTLIQRGDLGRIYAIEACFHNAYGPDKPWFYDRRAAGGGCLLDLGIHLVDLGLWALGFPTVERATGVIRAHREPDLRPGDTGVEDYATGQLELAGGTAMQLACSWRAPAGCDARIELTFFGTEGGASFRNVDGSFYHFVAEHFLRDRTRRVLAEPPDAWGGRAAVAWAQQLRVAPTFDPEIEHVTAVAAALDRLYAPAA